MQEDKLLLPSIEKMLASIIEKRPWLRLLNTDKNIFDYLRPAIDWKQQKDIFPSTALLSNIITSHIKRLYGESLADEAREQLEVSWVVETGAHLHIPRRYNRVAKIDEAQINSLLFQGQVLWSLAHQAFGHRLSIGLNSGRVPLDNTNSGAYLDLPALKVPFLLASKKRYPDTPQSLIPVIGVEEVERKIELLDMYKKQRILPEDQYLLGQEILTNFLKVQSTFSDQVSTTHALMLNKVLPTTQITLDSEFIGKDFMIALLKDSTSLTYKIFDDSSWRMKFLDYFSDIRTGWPKGGSPFYSISENDGSYKLTHYDGDLSPEIIIKGLKENALWLTGVMKFFIFMVEAGLLSSGGWTQTSYCTDVKNQAIKLLQELGYSERAEVLSQMPTNIAAVGPCWGVDEVDGTYQLLDAITTILNPSLIDSSKIITLTSNQTLLVATPTLYEFLLEEPARLSYKDLKEILQFAIVPRRLAE